MSQPKCNYQNNIKFKLCIVLLREDVTDDHSSSSQRLSPVHSRNRHWGNRASLSPMNNHQSVTRLASTAADNHRYVYHSSNHPQCYMSNYELYKPLVETIPETEPLGNCSSKHWLQWECMKCTRNFKYMGYIQRARKRCVSV